MAQSLFGIKLRILNACIILLMFIIFINPKFTLASDDINNNSFESSLELTKGIGHFFVMEDVMGCGFNSGHDKMEFGVAIKVYREKHEKQPLEKNNHIRFSINISTKFELYIVLGSGVRGSAEFDKNSVIK